MAQKRMFDNAIINTDKFMDMPLSAKALYFLLGMEADDYGFVSPRRVMKLHSNTDDDLKILIAKQYVIYFNSGVVVITDWKKNNWLDKRRIKQTEFAEELKLLKTFENKYVLGVAKPMLSECLERREENSTEENSIEENNAEEKKTKKGTICPKKYFENSELNDLFIEFLEQRKKLKAVNSERAINGLLNILKDFNDIKKMELIERSMVNSWKSIFPKETDKQDIDLPKWFNENFKEEEYDEEYLKRREEFVNKITKS